jgi:hypothetical protein
MMNVGIVSVIIMNVIKDCHYAECSYLLYHYAECCYLEHYYVTLITLRVVKLSIIMLNAMMSVIKLNVITVSVAAPIYNIIMHAD